MTNKGRDEFAKPTKDILAKRVSYLCSNPECRKTTVGAGQDPEKSVLIGVAAHITAASSGGPRYDDTLTPDQRCHIDNGIWLCSNCSVLIDKDENAYPIVLLKEWKLGAEKESNQKINGTIQNIKDCFPFLEVDLIYTHGGRWNRGYSDKNPSKIEDGLRIYESIDKPIIHWALDWNYKFVIYNNSMCPAYNLRIQSVGEFNFTEIDSLPKVNNIPPLKYIDLSATFEDGIESSHLEADEMLNSTIPSKVEKMVLHLIYYDDKRNEHITEIVFKDGEIENRKIK